MMRHRRTPRPAAALAAGAALLVPLAGGPPASAAAPTERTLTDPIDAGASYDAVSVRLFAAAGPGRRAKVVVKHDRRARSGDGIDMWIDLDGDRSPDVHLTGLAFSEYVVHRTRSFTGHGKDISDRDCVSLKITGRRAVVKLEPDCLGPSRTYAVAVRSFRDGDPKVGADWVPGPRRLSPKVASYARKE
jgi:hypothetical protein